MPPHKQSEYASLRPWAGFLLVTLLALAAVFSGLFFPYDPRFLLGRGDLWNYTLPLSFFFDHRIHAGEWPDWNPLLFCGTPFSANPQAAVFYPLHLLRALLHGDPTPWGTVVSVALEQGVHLLILAAGLFALARAHGLGALGAIVAAVAFVTSSAVLDSVIQFWHFVAVLAWLPWSMLFLRRALFAENLNAKTRSALALGVTLALNVLAGFPQMTLYTGLLLAVYGLLLRVAYGRPPGWTRTTPWLLGSDAAVYLVMGVVGILLAAPMLSPAALFSTLSDRAKDIGEDVALLNAIRLNPLAQPGQLLQMLLYYPGKDDMRMLGATGLLLALCALAHPRRRDVAIFGVLWLVMMDCAFQPSLIFGDLIAAVAPFKIAGPQRAAVPACMMLAMLAGFGADALRLSPAATVRPWVRTLLLTVVGGGVVWALVEWCWLDPEYVLPKATAVGVVLVPALAVLMLLLAGHAALRSRAAAILLVLLIVEGTIWNRHWLPWYIQQDAYPGELAPLHARQQLPATNARGVGGFDPAGRVNPGENIGVFALQPVMNGYDPLRLAQTNRFVCDARLEDRYNRYIRAEAVTRSHPRGFSFLKRRFWLAQTLSTAPMPDKASVLFPARRIYAVGRDDSTATEEPIASASLRSQPVSLPMAGAPVRLPAEGYLPVSRSAPGVPPRTRYLQVMYSADTAPGHARGQVLDARGSVILPALDLTWTAANTAETVVVPLPDQSPIAVQWQPLPEPGGGVPQLTVHHALVMEDPADLPEQIEIVRTLANAVEVQVRDLPEPRHLVFVESAVGWAATVNGVPVTPTRVNEAFLSVPLTAGTHAVRFEFQPLDRRWGLWVGLGSLLGITVLWFLLWRSARGMTLPAG
jgi:hypothetical protein